MITNVKLFYGINDFNDAALIAKVTNKVKLSFCDCGKKN